MPRVLAVTRARKHADHDQSEHGSWADGLPSIAKHSEVWKTDAYKRLSEQAKLANPEGKYPGPVESWVNGPSNSYGANAHLTMDVHVSNLEMAKDVFRELGYQDKHMRVTPKLVEQGLGRDRQQVDRGLVSVRVPWAKPAKSLKHLAGSHDQEDHGSWATGGAPQYKPGKWTELSDPTAHDQRIVKSVLDNLMKNPKYAGQEAEVRQELQKNYDASRNSGRVIANGNVQIRLPERPQLNEEKIAQIAQAVDRAMSFVPEAMRGDPKFPIEINLGKGTSDTWGRWTTSRFANHENNQGSSGGVISIKGDLFKDNWGTTANQLANTPESGVRPGYLATVAVEQNVSMFDYTVTHEIGHAVATWASGLHESEPWVINALDSYKGERVSYTRPNEQGFPIISRGISEYAETSDSERYAEHFAAWVFGQRDPFTDHLAEVSGWDSGGKK
jgi:hypothetical protein